MSPGITFRQGLAEVSRLWADRGPDAALAKVDQMRAAWPGNPHLHTLWANLAQLGGADGPGLDDIELALREAVGWDEGSPVAAIELGHLQDAVRDDPAAAAETFAAAATAARRLLVEALVGQAKALLQLDRWEDARRAATEARMLVLSGPADAAAADRVEAVLGDVAAARPATVEA